MSCLGTEKDRDTCQVEKMGCKGCGYNDSDIEQMIQELTEVNPSHLNKEAFRLFKTIMNVLDERDTLIQERDYYKARYQEFNDAFIQAGKDIYK